jgi:hypothetical protein
MTIQQILLQKINDRELKPASVKTYTTNFNKFLKESKIEINEIDDIGKHIYPILNFLSNLSNSKKRNIINPLLILLSSGRKNVPDKNKNTYDLLNGLLKKEIDEYKKVVDTGEFKQKEKDNYMDYNEIKKSVESEINKIFTKIPTLKDFKNKPVDLTKLVICALYVYIPPRRTIYSQTKIISISNYNKLSRELKDNNIYLVHKKRIPILFHFGKDAVKSPTEENLKVDLQEREKLATLLKYYLSQLKSENLFSDASGNQFNNNYFSKLVAKSFDKHVGKKLSVNMLRKFYSTSTSSEAYEKIQDDSKMMNHSVDTHLKIYTKKSFTKDLNQKVEPTKKRKFKIKKNNF